MITTRDARRRVEVGFEGCGIVELDLLNLRGKRGTEGEQSSGVASMAILDFDVESGGCLTGLAENSFRPVLDRL